MQISVDDLTDPAVVRLLDEHVSQLRAISPPGSSHALDLDALRRPEVTFWVAREDDVVLGCGALCEVEPGHGEVKSMRTATSARGRGVARAVLGVIVAEARRRGMTRLSLETGTADFFAPARALYRAHGFMDCGPFAAYGPDPHSTFLTREL